MMRPYPTDDYVLNTIECKMGDLELEIGLLDVVSQRVPSKRRRRLLPA